MKPANIADYRELARRRLPHFLFEYIDGGASDEVTLKRNRSDLERVGLGQRVLRDVSKVEPSIELFGRRWSLPVALGPVGLAGINARRGEVQAARAAEAAGIPFCLSTVSVCPIQEVATSIAGPFWFQLYMVRDRMFVSDLLSKAKAAGCDALVFTVDLPMPGIRYRDVRSGLTGARGAVGSARRLVQAFTRPGWLLDVGIRGRPHHLGNVAPVLRDKTGLEDFLRWMGENFDASTTWKDIDWIRHQWDGPLILKGILDPDDARRAKKAGADGIVVSNHGGRQLDGAPSTAAALPAIVDAVGGELTILADGGVRSGTDVIRLLGLGARAVLLGRAWAYALGARGQAGVAHMLRLLDNEVRITMALTGLSDLSGTLRDVILSE